MDNDKNVLEIDYRSVYGDEILRRIAQAANSLGLEHKQITDVKVLKTFGEGIKIKFITTDHFRIRG